MVKQFYLTHRWDRSGQSGPGSNGNNGLFHISQNSRIGASPADSFGSYPGHLLWGYLILLYRCILQSLPTGLRREREREREKEIERDSMCAYEREREREREREMVYLFNGMSTMVGYQTPKPSLEKNSSDSMSPITARIRRLIPFLRILIRK